jgi:hypothetical protein
MSPALALGLSSARAAEWPPVQVTEDLTLEGLAALI